VWSSFAPECRLILAAFVGPRTFDSALQLKLQMTAAEVLGVPCFFSDGFSCDLSALIEVYHTLKTFPRTGKPGRPRKPVKEPQPDLVYGQVIKKKRQGRLQELVSRVCCVAKQLEELGLSIRPSWIERLSLPLRHALAPLVRKNGSFCKDHTQMRLSGPSSRCAGERDKAARRPVPQPHRTPGRESVDSCQVLQQSTIGDAMLRH
jgi:hypothetical protein